MKTPARNDGIRHSDRMLALAFADSVDGEHAGADINIVNLGPAQAHSGCGLPARQIQCRRAEVTVDDEADDVSELAEDQHAVFGGSLLTLVPVVEIHNTDELLR